MSTDEQSFPYRTFIIASLALLLGCVAAGANCNHQGELTERTCIQQGNAPLECKVQRRQ